MIVDKTFICTQQKEKKRSFKTYDCVNYFTFLNNF